MEELAQGIATILCFIVVPILSCLFSIILKKTKENEKSKTRSTYL